MRRRFAFEKEKFLRLSTASQHKKCAEFLKEIQRARIDLIDSYQMLLSWMNYPPLLHPHDPKELSERLFEHLKLAGISRREYDLPTVCKGDRVDNAALPFLPIHIYLEGLRSAHNIGSIIRTTEAFRLGTLFFSENMIYPDHTKLAKSAMGTQEWVTCKKLASFSDLHAPLIALETIPKSTPYYEFVFPERFTLAVGNEEYGCSDALLKRADAHIHIPLYGRKNSLNVACAFAIVASAIISQKQKT